MPTYITKNRLSLPLIAAALMFGLSAWNTPAQAANVTTAEATMEMVMGDPNAPVTLHEYLSLTCPHCSVFYMQSLPTLKREFVDTGKVKIVYHDFPHNEAAVTAGMLARCVGAPRFFGVLGMMMRTQEQWYRADDPVSALLPTLRFAGMSEDDARSCLADTALRDFIIDARQEASLEKGITSVPSFILNGNKLSGGLSLEAFREVLAKAVADAGH